MLLSIFIRFVMHIFFAKVSVKSVACSYWVFIWPFLLENLSVLFILWIQVLYQICDLQIFYHSLSYLFIYSVCQREEFLTAMNPNLSNFCLTNYILVLHLGNPVQPSSQRFFPYFLSLEVLDFTFKCMIHFKLIFVYKDF